MTVLSNLFITLDDQCFCYCDLLNRRLIDFIFVNFLFSSSQYAGTIAGTFFLVFSIPLIICSGFLTSALLIIQESIQDERDYRCRDPEFYKDVSSHFAYFFSSFNVLSVVQTITTFFLLTFSSLYN